MFLALPSGGMGDFPVFGDFAAFPPRPVAFLPYPICMSGERGRLNAPAAASRTPHAGRTDLAASTTPRTAATATRRASLAGVVAFDTAIARPAACAPSVAGVGHPARHPTRPARSAHCGRVLRAAGPGRIPALGSTHHGARSGCAVRGPTRPARCGRPV
jgi:hypothetical protein